ncbi:hypothetical protein ACOSP7_031250 [Xanthoceras sorbifolium]
MDDIPPLLEISHQMSLVRCSPSYQIWCDLHGWATMGACGSKVGRLWRCMVPAVVEPSYSNGGSFTVAIVGGSRWYM